MSFENRPPLPEPVPQPKPGVVGTRPPELDMASGLLALLAVVSPMLLDPAQTTASASLTTEQIEASRVGMWFLTAIYGGILFAFWRGRNWARVMILVLSALSLVNLLSVMSYNSPISRVFLLLDVIVSAYLVFWLTRPEVVNYFKSEKKPSNL